MVTIRDTSRFNRVLQADETLVRILLNGNRTLDTHWNIRPRTMDEHLLYYLIDGEIVGRVGGENITASGGTVIWTSPEVEHRFEGIPESEPLTIANIRFQVEDRGVRFGFAEDYRIVRDDGRNRGLFSLIHDDIEHVHPDLNNRMKLYLRLLLSDFGKTGLDVSNETPGGLNYALRRRLRLFALEHIDQRLTPGDLADEIRLSRDYFSRQFKCSFGMSPKRWLVVLRIREAARRMEDSPERTISEIAYEFGYEDVFLFSRQFKSVMGSSPRNWRRR